MSGNVKLALSHVVPDLVLKVLKGQDPLHILGDGSQVRHYTYGGDLAHGIRLAMESDRDASTTTSTSRPRSPRRCSSWPTCIWRKIHGPDRAFRTSPTRRSSTTSRCASRTCARRSEVLGFEATTSLDTMLDEVIPWIRGEVEAGRL